MLLYSSLRENRAAAHMITLNINIKWKAKYNYGKKNETIEVKLRENERDIH